MGLPIRHLVVASKKSDVLHDFISTGVYDVSWITVFFLFFHVVLEFLWVVYSIQSRLLCNAKLLYTSKIILNLHYFTFLFLFFSILFFSLTAKTVTHFIFFCKYFSWESLSLKLLRDLGLSTWKDTSSWLLVRNIISFGESFNS